IAAARMRATIKSLTRTDSRTVFLTSHNLAEVEELCDRVAIISKGEIRAIDSPSSLRSKHTEQEQVSIAFTSLDLVDAERALAREFSFDFFVLEGLPSHSGREVKGAGLARTSPLPNASSAEEGAEISHGIVKFKRAVNDDLLNNVLRVLQESGAVI